MTDRVTNGIIAIVLVCVSLGVGIMIGNAWTTKQDAQYKEVGYDQQSPDAVEPVFPIATKEYCRHGVQWQESCVVRLMGECGKASR